MIRGWGNYSLREKWLVSLAGILFVGFLTYQFGFRPLWAYPHTQKQKWEQSNSDLAFMRESEKILSQTSQAGVQTIDAKELQPTITRLAVKYGLIITRRQPDGDTGITLWLDNAQSPALFSWIKDITNGHNINLSRINMNRNDDGSVRVQIGFEIGTKQ